MGLSKPIIVNTQQVTVTEQAVDLSGIENTLSTIKADASAAKTSAAQAAEAAMEGGAEGCIALTLVKDGTSVAAGGSLTLANVTGKGYLDLYMASSAASTDTITVVIDGVTFVNNKSYDALPYEYQGSYSLKRIPFTESCMVTTGNKGSDAKSNKFACQIILT